MRQQRDQALACMWLAICILLAVLLSVYGEADRVALANAEALLEVNVKAKDGVEMAIRNNQQALGDARAALEHIERAAR